MVAWRRGQCRKLAAKAPLIAPATVNRSTTQVLQRIFTRGRKVWRIPLPKEPHWRQHMLREPEERIRELRQDEDQALTAVMDPDYEVLRAFSIASGLRMRESLLRWSQVDFAAGVVITVGKGGKTIRMPMTTTMRRMLMSRKDHHAEFVFTYRVKRTRADRCRGERRPITIQGLKAHWRRCRKKAGVADYRWHDNRHTFATSLLRATGNLKLVHNALHHARIETTTKYAHVLDDELRAGMEKADRRRQPGTRRRMPKWRATSSNAS
nr:tyrosine-type recombinase/integrase [Rhodoplanes elegans]